jgi:hypothetical protein
MGDLLLDALPFLFGTGGFLCNLLLYRRCYSISKERGAVSPTIFCIPQAFVRYFFAV